MLVARTSIALRARTPCSPLHQRSVQLAKLIAPKANSSDSEPGEAKTPEWVPEQTGPLLEFFASESFKLQESELYKQYLQKYVENEWFAKSTGWKHIPELINGRAAMLGFVAAAGAELFGQGPVLSQLSRSGVPVLEVLGLVIASTLIPIIKGTEKGYLASLRDTYALPADVFTEKNERVHGRLAMVGIAGLIALELVFARAIL